MKFNWEILAFDFSDQPRKAHRVLISEAEDKVNEATMLVKQIKSGDIPEPSGEELDIILTDLSTVTDKLRKVSKDLRNL